MRIRSQTFLKFMNTNDLVSIRCKKPIKRCSLNTNRIASRQQKSIQDGFRSRYIDLSVSFSAGPFRLISCWLLLSDGSFTLGFHISPTNVKCIIFLFRVTIESVLWLLESAYHRITIKGSSNSIWNDQISRRKRDIRISPNDALLSTALQAIVWMCGSCVNSFAFEFRSLETTLRNWKVNLFSVTFHLGFRKSECNGQDYCPSVESSLSNLTASINLHQVLGILIIRWRFKWWKR